VYFQHCSRRESRQARQVFRLWLLLMVGMGITGVAALVLVKDVVAKLLLAQSYYSGAALMPIIGAGCAIQALGTVLAQRLFAVKSTQAVLAGRACGALTAVVAIPLMVQWQGMLGAAMAAPLYFGVEAMSMALLGRKLGFRPVLSSRQPCPVAES
jgi:O-antigen/teichoic acid export membrane protein